MARDRESPMLHSVDQPVAVLRGCSALFVGRLQQMAIGFILFFLLCFAFLLRASFILLFFHITPFLLVHIAFSCPVLYRISLLPISVSLFSCLFTDRSTYLSVYLFISMVYLCFSILVSSVTHGSCDCAFVGVYICLCVCLSV